MIARARELGAAALANLERNRRRIDDLNVYPVPDGDTGTNMTLTVRAIVEALHESAASDRAALAKELTRAALMGARGNSGVIFSQIVRGFAEVYAERDDLAAAFRSASDAAYGAVKQPVEGTILTVIRELAEAAEAAGEAPPPELLRRVVEHGEEALARTPAQLEVLRQAGVVDAGAAGLLEIVRGIALAAAGETIPEAEEEHEELSHDAIHQELSLYRYCTVFVVEGEELDAGALERELERIGDSLLVVGDADALKVHMHTDEPGAALALATRVGVIEGVEIANMHRQAEEREQRLLAALPEVGLCGVVAVVAGEGNRRLFLSLGATKVIEGGQTMNPSAAQIHDAIVATGAEEVLVLPNNSNIVLTAEQAALMAEKPVRVVPATSIQAGLAAMVAFDTSLSAEENAEAMGEIVAEVATGAVTVASRDVEWKGLKITKGAYLGMHEGEPVAGGAAFDEVARSVAELLLAEPRGVLTLLTGEDEPELDALIAELAERYPALEVDVHAGGQPHYPLLLSAE